MKKLILSVAMFVIADVVKANIVESVKVEGKTDAKINHVVMYKGEENIEFAIITKLEEDCLVCKYDVLNEETFKLPYEGNEIYMLSNVFKSNFKGEMKAELFAMCRYITTDVQKSVRIGGIFFPDATFKTSDEGRRVVLEIEQWLNKEFGVKVSSRWSDNSGKYMKRSGGGFNVSVNNNLMKEKSALFLNGVYHHTHYKMIAFDCDGKDWKITDAGDEAFVQMIKAYRELEVTAGITNAVPTMGKVAKVEEAAKAEAGADANAGSNQAEPEHQIIELDNIGKVPAGGEEAEKLEEVKVEAETPVLSKNQQKKIAKAKAEAEAKAKKK
jgi:hypothetical protein